MPEIAFAITVAASPYSNIVLASKITNMTDVSKSCAWDIKWIALFIFSECWFWFDWDGTMPMICWCVWKHWNNFTEPSILWPSAMNWLNGLNQSDEESHFDSLQGKTIHFCIRHLF